MSHPDDTGSSAVGKALSAIRRLRRPAVAPTPPPSVAVPPTPRVEDPKDVGDAEVPSDDEAAELAEADPPPPVETMPSLRTPPIDDADSDAASSHADESDDAAATDDDAEDETPPHIDESDDASDDAAVLPVVEEAVDDEAADIAEADPPAFAETAPELRPAPADTVVEPDDDRTDAATTASDDVADNGTDRDNADTEYTENDDTASIPATDEPVDTDETAAEVADVDPPAPVETVPSLRPSPADAGTDTGSDHPVGGDSWRSDVAAPQYIPPPTTPAPEREGRSRRVALWVGSLVIIVVAVAAVVIAVFATRGDPAKPPADTAASVAIEYTTALGNGDLTTLRSVTCGERKQFYDGVDDAAFRQQFETQKANNELIGVKGVRASRIVDATNAIVEVTAFRTATPDQTTDVALRLRKEGDAWKVCTTG